MIPKIIHQTWKTNDVPTKWKQFVKSWKSHHPDWQYKLYTNADGYEFIEHYYPSSYDAYCRYPYDIQRADSIRYHLLYHYGGIYADLDFECLQSFKAMRNSTKLILGCEPDEHATSGNELNSGPLLSNALLVSQPGSKFLKRVIDFLVADDTGAVTHADVISTTGPLMLRKVYEQVNKEDVDVHPRIRFYPFSSNAPELTQLATNSAESDQIRQELINQDCFAVHHWANSWVSNVAGELLNPTPNSIDGFNFHPFYDSIGMDLFNGGRDIQALAERCINDPQVVAFNTDGFAKHTISAPTSWNLMENSNKNEGLYVKTSITQTADL